MNRAIGILARGTALAGGAVLLLLIVMTCVSILGRAGLTLSAIFDLPALIAHMRPVRGDYELVEMGSAVAIFAFLPWCHWSMFHARVDLLAGHLPVWLDRGLSMLWDWVMLVVIAVIAWRLWYGMLGKISGAETTFLRQIPLWWAYAACFVCAVVGVIVALWIALNRVAGQMYPAGGQR